MLFSNRPLGATMMPVLSSVRSALLSLVVRVVVVVVVATTASTVVVAAETAEETAYNLDNYCRTTQQLIADHERVLNANVNAPAAVIQHFTNFKEFEKSHPSPYSPLFQKPKNLTLIVPQFSGTHPGVINDNDDNPDYDGDVAHTVLCKMKSADALEKYYSSHLPILGSSSRSSSSDSSKSEPTNDLFSCNTINKNIIATVIEELKEDDPSFSVPFDKIVYKEWKTYIGSQWTSNSPSVTAYISNESATGEGEGEMVVLNMVAKGLHDYVTVHNWWMPIRHIVGVQYCQTITYEYALSILIEEVVPPVCTSSPPTYKHMFSKEKKWDCPMSTTSTTTGTEL